MYVEYRVEIWNTHQCIVWASIIIYCFDPYEFTNLVVTCHGGDTDDNPEDPEWQDDIISHHVSDPMGSCVGTEVLNFCLNFHSWWFWFFMDSVRFSVYPSGILFFFTIHVLYLHLLKLKLKTNCILYWVLNWMTSNLLSWALYYLFCFTFIISVNNSKILKKVDIV